MTHYTTCIRCGKPITQPNKPADFPGKAFVTRYCRECVTRLPTLPVVIQSK